MGLSVSGIHLYTVTYILQDKLLMDLFHFRLDLNVVFIYSYQFSPQITCTWHSLHKRWHRTNHHSEPSSAVQSHKISQRILCYYTQKQYAQPFFHYIPLEDSHTMICTDNWYNNNLKMHLRLFVHLELVSAQCCNIVPSMRQDTSYPESVLRQEHPMARNRLRKTELVIWPS